MDWSSSSSDREDDPCQISSCGRAGRRPRSPDRLVIYSDADLAAEMNALSFSERQALEEDLHGVRTSGYTQETDTLVDRKIAEMHKWLDDRPVRESRQLWDKAAFLRPSLGEDRELFLTFLRARSFDSKQAAQLLLKYYQRKAELFGEELLIHRITLNDLTEQEREIVRSGIYQIIPNRERAGRGVAYARFCEWDLGRNSQALVRSFWYCQSRTIDLPDVQKKGVVVIGDLRGQWKSSTMEMLSFLASPQVRYLTTNFPHNWVSTHMLLDDPKLEAFMRANRAFLRKDNRLRYRVHYGSSMEIGYSLRTFGIDIMDYLQDGTTGAALARYHMENELLAREMIEEKWLQLELPYRQASSRVALHPNPQDVIMGRKGTSIAWPGNLHYNQVIEDNVHRYIDAREGSGDRMSKTLIAIEVLYILQNNHQVRFLRQKKNNDGIMLWESIDDEEAQKKISQALRRLSRDIVLKQNEAASFVPANEEDVMMDGIDEI